ncbi:MAG: LptE family protein [Candidatus Cloacimonadaceae bacterium]|nr:LptE family protein [Candidatus Cloacimonadaceae bacterium]MDP3114714.1 LptE family protein [Candidatus Cloacimonadaceae bacterium]
MPFENQSAEFGISEKVYNQLSVAFRNDGRLKVVNQQPDCLLEGGVISFEERVYSYDAANNVQDYQLRLTLAISFTDLIRNEVIYENKSLTLMEAYAVSTESTAKSKSKEEAIDELINSLFKTVVQNSLEKW